MVKLTNAQRSTLEALLVGESAFVNKGTAKALAKSGLVDRRSNNDGDLVWFITTAGREAVRK